MQRAHTDSDSKLKCSILLRSSENYSRSRSYSQSFFFFFIQWTKSQMKLFIVICEKNAAAFNWLYNYSGCFHCFAFMRFDQICSWFFHSSWAAFSRIFLFPHISFSDTVHVRDHVRLCVHGLLLNIIYVWALSFTHHMTANLNVYIGGDVSMPSFVQGFSISMCIFVPLLRRIFHFTIDQLEENGR